MSESRADVGLDLVCRCLRMDEVDRTELTRQIAKVGWEQLFAAADAERLGSALVQAVYDRSLAPSIPAVVLPDGRLTVPAALAQRRDEHIRRRGILLERLDELAQAFNVAGIVPLVLKGGRSLCTGEPEWRSLRDLDLLVPVAAAAEAQSVARRIRYSEGPAPKRRLFHHHQSELYREDLPGWVEIHHRAGVSRVEQFLGSAELLTSASPVILPRGGRVGILPAHLHILNGALHHHIGHSGVRLKVIEPKGLFEFAAELAIATAEQRGALLARASRHPRTLAVLELWCAAASDLFGLRLEPPLRLFPDAQDWWQRLRQGRVVGKGAREERQMAVSAERMQRAAGGDNPLRRMFWRVSMPLTFARRPSLAGALKPGWRAPKP